MPEGQSLYPLKLLPRILIQTCCSSTSYILIKVSIYGNNVKRIVGWITISHCYNFPLLQTCNSFAAYFSKSFQWLNDIKEVDIRILTNVVMLVTYQPPLSWWPFCFRVCKWAIYFCKTIQAQLYSIWVYLELAMDSFVGIAPLESSLRLNEVERVEPLSNRLVPL